MTEIQDWQFGRLKPNDTGGWCAEHVEWTPGRTIDLCIQMDLTESDTIPERVRAFANSVRDREKEFASAAAADLLNAFNGIWESDAPADRPEGWPYSVQGLIDLMELLWATVDPDGDSELDYATGGGPLVCIFISPGLHVEGAYLD
jgi:hypothetical protein